MKWSVLPAVLLGVLVCTPAAARATVPPEQPPDTTVVETTTTLPLIIEPESGAPVAAPSELPSAPLLQIPNGCPSPPNASVVFVGRVVAKDYRVARYRIDEVRAGTTAGYALGDLIDIRYGNEVEYLDVSSDYLVGAVPQGPDRVMTSKVRPAKPLFGGNAVIGLTEKASECPVIEDPVRTLHVDGTEIDAGMFHGLAGDKQSIALAFAKPVVAVLAIVLGLVLVRWLFAAIFAAVRRAADGEPIRRTSRSA